MRHLAGDDSRDVQHLLDETNLGLGIALDDRHGMGRARVQVPTSQDPRPPVNRVQRRAQFMRERAEKLVLQAIRLLGLAIELDAIERQADAADHIVEHQQAGPGEAMLVLRQQRHHRLDTALHRQRQHRGRLAAASRLAVSDAPPAPAGRGSRPRPSRRPAQDVRTPPSHRPARRRCVPVSEPDRPIVADDVDQRRVRKKRHGESAARRRAAVRRHDRRQLLREARQKRERCHSLPPARACALSRALPARPAPSRSALFVAAERLLRSDPLGDVDGMSEHLKRAVGRLRQDVAIQPDSMSLRSSSLHAHQAFVAALLANPAQVVVELVAPVRREKVAQIAADAVRAADSRATGQQPG